MSRMLCVAVVVSAAICGLATPGFAGMSEGVAAVTVGDYPRAIQEFEPLAAAGDPAAQYQLAKIYLEGHGPTDDVPKGVDLMTKAANGNYPEAQAQLGLMYAMGLGVPVDNAKAYDWLNKAITALPEGTRRTVAESNRDAVQKRMNEAERTVAAAPTAAEPAAPAEPADSAVTQAASAPASPEPAPEPTPEPAPAPKAAEPTPAEPAATTATAETPSTKPADPAPVKAPETKAAEPMPAPPPADPDPTQTASAPEKPADKPAAAPAAADAPVVKAEGSASVQDVQSSVRVQLASMPTEEMAWAQWKKISDKFAEQVNGLTAIVQPADLGSKGTFYRVQTGPFADIAAAEQRCAAMKQAGLDCLVIGAN
jgi:uncharacterized protein